MRNEDLFKKQVTKAGKTFELRFKHKWLKELLACLQ